MDNPTRPLFQWCPPQIEEKTLGKEYGVAFPPMNSRQQNRCWQTTMVLNQTLYRPGQHEWMINRMNQKAIRFTEVAQRNQQTRKGSATRLRIDKDGGIRQINLLCNVQVVSAQHDANRQ